MYKYLFKILFLFIIATIMNSCACKKKKYIERVSDSISYSSRGIKVIKHKTIDTLINSKKIIKTEVIFCNNNNDDGVDTVFFSEGSVKKIVGKIKSVHTTESFFKKDLRQLDSVFSIELDTTEVKKNVLKEETLTEDVVADPYRYLRYIFYIVFFIITIYFFLKKINLV